MPGTSPSGCVDLPGAALGKLDADLGEIYRRALHAGPRRKAFAARQAQWVREERDACADAVMSFTPTSGEKPPVMLPEALGSSGWTKGIVMRDGCRALHRRAPCAMAAAG
jgi:hypothetical protein